MGEVYQYSRKISKLMFYNKIGFFTLESCHVQSEDKTVKEYKERNVNKVFNLNSLIFF